MDLKAKNDKLAKANQVSYEDSKRYKDLFENKCFEYTQIVTDHGKKTHFNKEQTKLENQFRKQDQEVTFRLWLCTSILIPSVWLQIHSLKNKLAEASRPLPKGERPPTPAGSQIFSLTNKVEEAKAAIVKLTKDNADLKQTIENKGEVAHMKKEMDKLAKDLEKSLEKNKAINRLAGQWIDGVDDGQKKLNMLIGFEVFKLSFSAFFTHLTPTQACLSSRYDELAEEFLSTTGKPPGTQKPTKKPELVEMLGESDQCE